MNKVFLFLYPIKEYMEMFLFYNDNLYDEWKIKRPLPILNECIQKRYRENGYKIVFVLYPDKEIFGVNKFKEDDIIYTNVLFSEASGVDEKGNIKKNFVPKYPNEQEIIKQLGYVDELVIGGYHALDCVKRVGETALNMGMNTIVDLDLTDLFFQLYKQEEYFNIYEYNPEKFKEQYINSDIEEDKNVALKQFNKNYSSPVYGFSEVTRKK